MEFKVYEHADRFLKDNKGIMTQHKYDADLLWVNAQSKKGLKEGFTGYRLELGAVTYLAIQNAPYPLVNYCFGGEPSVFATVLAQYLKFSRKVPNKLSGNPDVVKALVDAFEELDIRFKQSRKMCVRVCKKQVDYKPVEGSFLNLKDIDVNLGSWLVGFNKDCKILIPIDDATQAGIDMAESGDYYVWMVDGKPVSMASTSRSVPGGKCVTAVYTPPKFRGKGYSSACVAEVTKIVLQDKWAFLYVDLSNPIANHIYEKLGFERMHEFVEFTKS